MTSDLENEVHHETRPEEDAFVRRALDRSNDSVGPFDEIRPLRCFARGTSGEIIGAAIGHAWGAPSELGQLWVEESHRRRGIGSRLLERFELEARSMGSTQVYLDTFSFHAPGFYRAHRYEVACQFEGLPHGAFITSTEASARF